MPRRARMAALGAVAGVALLILTWYAAFHIGVFKRADQSIYRGFGGLGRGRHVTSVANVIAAVCNPKPYALLCLAPVTAALARRRAWVATAIVAILVGANVTTQLLKPLLATPRPGPVLGRILPPLPASWPSGHATAAMALALCALLAAPSRWRPLVAALGAVFAVGVSYSFLTLHWHYPSDVFGGFLVAAVWTLLGVAALFTADDRRQKEPAARTERRISVRQALGPPAVALLGVAVLAGLVILARPHAVVAYVSVHGAFVIGAAAIGVLGLALATGVMLALRR